MNETRLINCPKLGKGHMGAFCMFRNDHDFKR